jgi:hypothetical protein
MDDFGESHDRFESNAAIANACAAMFWGSRTAAETLEFNSREMVAIIGYEEKVPETLDRKASSAFWSSSTNERAS